MDDLDTAHMAMLGYDHAEYVLYDDDGMSKEYEKSENYRTLRKE